jgi:hypothetical protein
MQAAEKRYQEVKESFQIFKESKARTVLSRLEATGKQANFEVAAYHLIKASGKPPCRGSADWLAGNSPHS